MSSIDDLLSDIGDAMANKDDSKISNVSRGEKMKPRPPPQDKSPKKAFSRSKYHGGAGSSTRSQDDDYHDEGPQNIGENRDRTASDGSMNGENSFDRLMNLLSTGDKEVDNPPTNIFSKQWSSGEPRSPNRCHASPNNNSSSTSRYGQSSESKSVVMTTTSSSIGDGFDDDDDVGGGGGHAATQRADEKSSSPQGWPRENKSHITTATATTSASAIATSIGVSRSNSRNVPSATSEYSSKDSLISVGMIDTKKNSDVDDDDDDWDNPDSAAIHSRTSRIRLNSSDDDTSPGSGIRRSPTVKHLSSVASIDDVDDSPSFTLSSGLGGGGGSNEHFRNSGKEYHENGGSSRMRHISGDKGGAPFGSNSNMGGGTAVNSKGTSEGASSTPTPMYYNRGSYYYNSTTASSSSSSSGQSSLFGSSPNAATSSNNNTSSLVAISQSQGSHSHSGHGSGHVTPHSNNIPSTMDSSSNSGSSGVGSGLGSGRGGSSTAISSTTAIPSISSNHGPSSSAGIHHSSSHSSAHSSSHNSAHNSAHSSSHTSFKLPASTALSTIGGGPSGSTSAKAKCIRTVLAGPTMARGIRSSVFSKCACNHLRCLSCNFKVHVFLGYEWTSNVDYMFFRNNVPNEANLALQLSTSADSAAYCCQCSWTQVSGGDERILLAQGNAKDPQWVCAGH